MLVPGDASLAPIAPTPTIQQRQHPFIWPRVWCKKKHLGTSFLSVSLWRFHPVIFSGPHRVRVPQCVVCVVGTCRCQSIGLVPVSFVPLLGVFPIIQRQHTSTVPRRLLLFWPPLPCQNVVLRCGPRSVGSTWGHLPARHPTHQRSTAGCPHSEQN